MFTVGFGHTNRVPVGLPNLLAAGLPTLVLRFVPESVVYVHVQQFDRIPSFVVTEERNR